MLKPMTAQDEDHVWNLVHRNLGRVTFLSYPDDNMRGMTFELNVNLTDEGIQYASEVLQGSGVTLSWKDSSVFTATLR